MIKRTILGCDGNIEEQEGLVSCTSRSLFISVKLEATFLKDKLMCIIKKIRYDLKYLL